MIFPLLQKHECHLCKTNETNMHFYIFYIFYIHAHTVKVRSAHIHFYTIVPNIQYFNDFSKKIFLYIFATFHIIETQHKTEFQIVCP